MENTGLKGLAVTLYQRVIMSYKSTFIGIGVAAAGVAINYMSGSSNHTVALVGGILGSIFVLVKDKLPAPPPPAP